jgi:hypothetical protein
MFGTSVSSALLVTALLGLSACGGPGDLFTAAGVTDLGTAGMWGAGSAGQAGAGGSAGVHVILSPNLPASAGASDAGASNEQGGASNEQGGAKSGVGGDENPEPKPEPAVTPLEVDGVCKGKLVKASALIEDFEHGVNGWATYLDDQFGAPTSTAPGAALTGLAATFSGGQADISGLFKNLRCTDVSAFTGISFWAKGRGGDHVRFLAVIPATQPTTEGGDCDDASEVCWDHPGKLLVLSDHWQQYRVAWKDLEQYGWGTPATFGDVLSALLWINDGPVAAFEFSIDQVQLYTDDAP